MVRGPDGELVGDAALSGHVFYDRLQSVLIEAGFDAFARRAAGLITRPGWARPRCRPGAISGCTWWATSRASTASAVWSGAARTRFSLRAFLRLGSRDRVPDHSWLSRSRTRLPHEVHAGGLRLGSGADRRGGLIKGERIGVDASTMEANAALRNIVRRDNGEGYREMLERLARKAGSRHPRPRTWRVWSTSARARSFPTRIGFRRATPRPRSPR